MIIVVNLGMQQICCYNRDENERKLFQESGQDLI